MEVFDAVALSRRQVVSHLLQWENWLLVNLPKFLILERKQRSKRRKCS